jgi:alpha-ketoglutarate-dependent 2,4-dichlorophenoxyacetate dioxygenase
MQMRAAYDGLDDETKAEIGDMICEHTLMYSLGLGFLEYTEEEKEMFKPVLQRLVRTHPVHGRKSPYMSSHAGGIVSMTVPEAGCCRAISPRTPPSRNSSTCTNGDSTMS